MQKLNLQSIWNRRFDAMILTGAIIVTLGVAIAPPVFSHGEQVKVNGGAKGPVSLTSAQQKTLGIKLVAADLRPLSELLYLNGEVRLLPGRQADVSTRISGQIMAVYANLGDTVRAGQRLARVQSRLIGNPPPSVDIVAPTSGVIDTLGVSVGQAVEPSTSLFRISDRSQVNIVARVYEEDLGKVKVGQNTTVHTLSYPDQPFTGKIMLLGPALDPQTRTVEVWIRIDNADGLLKPNMFARAGIVLRENSAALTVPNEAIIAANGEKCVFVLQKGKFVRVDVITGTNDEKFTEITKGLVPGDKIVTVGNREIYTLWLTGGVLQGEDD
jgi:membrane fusion protein, heavy metal efflux system